MALTGPAVCYTRGDSSPVQFTLKDSNGDVVDITGRTYIMTVDTLEDPGDALTNVFSSVGTLVDAPNGRVDFPVTDVQSDQTPSEYFYDIQQTTTGAKKTIAKGTFTVEQDITKA